MYKFIFLRLRFYQSSRWEGNWSTNGKSAFAVQRCHGSRPGMIAAEIRRQLLPRPLSASCFADSERCHLEIYRSGSDQLNPAPGVNDCLEQITIPYNSK